MTLDIIHEQNPASPVTVRVRRPRQPPKRVTLLLSKDGYRQWTWDDDRFLVMVQHDIDRPTHVLTAPTEAVARNMVDRAAALHAADDSVCLVHFWQPAEVAGTVVTSHDYGSNGRVGRNRSTVSERRYRRERKALEQLLRPNPAKVCEGALVISTIIDDSLLNSRLLGHYSPTPGAQGRAAELTDPTVNSPNEC